jgi:flagellar hook-length control protein FliK
MKTTTMQTTTLPIQSGAASGNANQTARNAPSPSSDAGQFGAMLSNEMEQRLAAAPMPMPAPAPAAPKPLAADKPAQPDDAPAPARASQSNEAAKSAQSSNNADDAKSADDAGDESADSEDAGKADPAAQMLALMASLQQPVQDAGKAGKNAAAQAFDALGGGKGKRSELQLAALQAAMKSVAKDGSADAGGKTFAAPGIKNPALAATGADLATDTKAAATGDAADPRAALATGAVKAELKPQMIAADLALQQARTSAAQADAAPAAAAMAQAQPAMLEAAQAAFAAGETLNARVGTSQWEHQVGQKIVYMVGSEEQTASLTLNPPDLGPMQVVLSVTNDLASVTFSSNQQEVRQALENALPRLREMMSESGIALGNATVNAGMPDGRQAQDQGAQSGGGFGRSSGQRDGGPAGVAETATRPSRTAVIGDRGMVDTFA